jgi:hypothetical protein
MEYEKLIKTINYDNDEDARPPNIALLRIEYNMEPASVKKRPSPTASEGGASKRKKSTQLMSLKALGGTIQLVGMNETSTAPAAATSTTKPARKKNTKEYVDIATLYHSMNSLIHQFVGGGKIEGSYMRAIAALIGLTGTDFSRKLPQITPTKIWEALSDPKSRLGSGLVKAFDTNNSQLRIDEACNSLVAQIYAIKFINHVPMSCRGSIDAVLKALKRSKLSEKTKDQLPSRLRYMHAPLFFDSSILQPQKTLECLLPMLYIDSLFSQPKKKIDRLSRWQWHLT